MNLKNSIYTGAKGRKSLVDFQEPKDDYQAIIIFVHGYKGYKDWGAWNLVQDFFVGNGYAFCKFNLSHNGGTIENPIDFPDLAAFAENKYSYEVEDVGHILDWLEEKVNLKNKSIHLIGHSRGGGIVTLKSGDSRVSSIITWASISAIGARFPEGEELENWKIQGVLTIKNSRTQQDMPQNYSIYEDWLENKEKLDIQKVAEKKYVPALHLHGDNDDSVSITASEYLSSWTEGKLMIIGKANHTFNTYQPYDKEEMPNKLNEVCVLTNNFMEHISS